MVFTVPAEGSGRSRGNSILDAGTAERLAEELISGVRRGEEAVLLYSFSMIGSDAPQPEIDRLFALARRRLISRMRSDSEAD